MILLTGATGNTGSLVARLLFEKGVPFRCMARREDALQALRDQGFDAVHGDFDQPETLAAALEGVSKAFLVCTPDHRLVERESNLIDAAVANGVGHIVKLSALMAAPDAPTPNLRFHGEVEGKLAQSGLAYTIVRPHGFMQTLYSMSQMTIDQQGIMAYPGGDGSASYIDLRDVAAAVAEILTSDGHQGKAYDLTGPEAVSFSEIADMLAQALGRPVHYIDMPEAELVGILTALGVPPPAREHVVGIFRLTREGKLAFTTSSLEELGIEARSYQQFASDLASGATAAAVSFKPPAPPPT